MFGVFIKVCTWSNRLNQLCCNANQDRSFGRFINEYYLKITKTRHSELQWNLWFYIQ